VPPDLGSGASRPTIALATVAWSASNERRRRSSSK
jgi:hypothetical protein